MRFRRMRYVIDRATVQFPSGAVFNPEYDITAETQVREYEVRMHLSGDLDKLEYELTSNPPLPQQQILALLLTGVASPDETNIPSDQLGNQAASVVGGEIGSVVGGQLERWLGIEEIRIEPFVASGTSTTTDPTTRVTLGKRLSPRIFVRTAVSLNSPEDPIYQVEYSVTRKVRFQLERGELGSVGGGVRYGTRFFLPSVRKEGEALGTVVKRPAARKIGQVRFVGDADLDGTALRRIAHMRPGADFTRQRMVEGADRLKKHLVKESYLEASVRPGQREVAGGLVDVEYTVEKGPKVVVAIEGAGTYERRIRDTLKSLWQESSFGGDFAGEAEEKIRRLLQEEGFYACLVEAVTRAGRGREASDVPHRPRGEGGRADDRPRGRPLDPRERRARAGPHGRGFALPAPAARSPPCSPRTSRRSRTSIAAAGSSRYRRARTSRCRLTPGAPSSGSTWWRGPPRSSDPSGSKAPMRSPRRPCSSSSTAAPARRFFPRRWWPTGTRSAASTTWRDTPRPRWRNGSSGKARASISSTGSPKASRAASRRSRSRATRSRTRASCCARCSSGPGDPISTEKMRQTRQNLMRTGLFSDAQIRYDPAAAGTEGQMLRVKVTEAENLILGLGGGYDNVNGPRASVDFADVNLFGTGRYAGVSAIYGGKLRRGQITFKEPHVFGWLWGSTLSLFYENRQRDSFSQRQVGSSALLERKTGGPLSHYLRYSTAVSEVFDLKVPESTFRQENIRLDLGRLRLASIGYAIVRDTRNDPFVATRGTYASADLRTFDRPLGSEKRFAKLFVQGSYYRKLPLDVIWSSSLRVGAAWRGQSEAVPLQERYFAGGDSTVRGFRQDRLGFVKTDKIFRREMQDTDNDGTPDTQVRIPIIVDTGTLEHETLRPLGGESLVIVNNELRRKLYGGLSATMFLDVGNTYPRVTDVFSGHMRYAGGLGLRFDTPVGPLRLEYGRKLNRERGESPGEFILSLGQTF